MKHTKEEVERKIGQWRRQYVAGKLTADQISKIESIPGWSWEQPKMQH